jgi:hypothetical protein
MSCFGEKMVGFVSDGAQHMIGKNNGTATKLKNSVSTVFFMKKPCVQTPL